MDPSKQALLEALKLAAQAGAEARLYRRGKLPGLFPQRTRLSGDVASQALADGLLESTRVEIVGKTSIEWVRVTPKGLAFLLESESPTRALEELRDALALNERALPAWADQMQQHMEAMSKQFALELAAMRDRLEQLSRQVHAALARVESARAEVALPGIAWVADAIEYLDRRRQVGLGTRCPLADLFHTLREKHPDLTIKDFHAGLRALHRNRTLTLLPGATAADTPGPEYALLEGAAVYYYVTRADESASRIP